MELITTRNQSRTSTQGLAEKLLSVSEKDFCPKCGLLNCRCEQIAREKAWLKTQEARFEQERLEQASRFLGGVRAYEDFTAEKYTNKAVLDILKNYPAENYFLWGKAGVGKTHAAVAVLRNVPMARVVRMGQISREIRCCEDAYEEGEIIEKYAKGEYLFDDLGSEKATDFLKNMLFEIMDLRWQNKRGGLIITSNMSIEKLGEVIGDRTASRIAGLVGSKNVIELDGKDYRLGGLS